MVLGLGLGGILYVLLGAVTVGLAVFFTYVVVKDRRADDGGQPPPPAEPRR